MVHKVFVGSNLWQVVRNRPALDLRIAQIALIGPLRLDLAARGCENSAFIQGAAAERM